MIKRLLSLVTAFVAFCCIANAQAFQRNEAGLGLKYNKIDECPHVPKLAKFKPPRCPIGVYWNTLCLMRDVWTIKTYMI